MEILHLFGLETPLFLFQLVNFLIIVAVLTKFLYKPLKNMLDERRRRIEQSLRDAEDAKTALENAGEERKKILSIAKKDADELSASTKVMLKETQEKITQEANDRSKQIIEEAKQRAAVELENVSKQAGLMSVDLSGKIISKVFSNFFTDEDKQKMLSKALDKIAKGEYEKSSN